MADEQKPQLTEEERIARKTKLFRLISKILVGVAIVVIAVFIFFAYGTKKNINTQTAMDTQELRSKLKQIIALEIKYKEEHGDYSRINFLQLNKEIPIFDPNPSGNFKYKFDPQTGIATGMEKDASSDVNGDDDGKDGLTLSVKWEPGKTDDSDFFWTDEDIADLQKRAAEQK
jgi:cell division protein FtsL